MQLLATTVPGLEAIAREELRDLVGEDADPHHRGAVAFEGDADDVFDLLVRARSIHRVLVRVAEGPIRDLEDAYDVAAGIDVEWAFEPGQSFGVDASRHGDHEFTSVEVGERIGQAIVDESRAAFGERLPVDLDDPEAPVRAYVRDDRLVIALDATGESLHKRPYRVCDHHAPLRPTIGHAMLRLVGYDPADDLLDPMCGGGTIPLEAAQWARGIPPTEGREEFAGPRLALLPDDGIERARDRHDPRDREPSVRGIDEQERWIRCSRANAEAAGLTDDVEFAVGDATEADLDADVIAVDLPFGIRTASGIHGLYRAFGDALAEGSWDRLVALTTRPELLPLDPTRTVDLRYGRLEATIVVVER